MYPRGGLLVLGQVVGRPAQGAKVVGLERRAEPGADGPQQRRRGELAEPAVAMGESVIKRPSPLNVLKDTCDQSCY